jgi:hypothetical protein
MLLNQSWEADGTNLFDAGLVAYRANLRFVQGKL